MSLFSESESEDESDDGDAERFRIRPEFEGRAGQKVSVAALLNFGEEEGRVCSDSRHSQT